MASREKTIYYFSFPLCVQRPFLIYPPAYPLGMEVESGAAQLFWPIVRRKNAVVELAINLSPSLEAELAAAVAAAIIVMASGVAIAVEHRAGCHGSGGLQRVPGVEPEERNRGD